ncbi:transcription factor CYCLOIDEA-like [Actinidia eriantha]|uniref:transcription factor CYCLOIDEA-like n=1 Tax=Actinidia eriantha TaxID=165200 RepID=UPI002588A30B|nr:transcription factor CYCLOIDEA-like [Actinidia eriantha]XP_057480684.1 transcription factor CYCLOIDEA-like [Actinidia eriantha]
MYPFNTNGNLISYTLYHGLNNPNSKQDHPPPPPLSSLSYFPSPPYMPYEDDDLVFLHDLFLSKTTSETTNLPDNSNKQCQSPIERIQRKRSHSKKDRHSKINTAQGPRDRRMRLSLEVAREFFSLQDMLGFDKASKTVEWLLNMSKSAIKELTRGANSASSTSECEVVSGIDESLAVKTSIKAKSTKSSAKEKKIRELKRKSTFNHTARESRDKARARARERTSEKKKIEEVKLPNLEANMSHDMNRFRSWSDHPFDNRDKSCTHSHNNINPHLDVLAHDVEELSSSMIYNHNSGISQENQFTDFQVYGKPWEAYNNVNLC